MKDFSKLTIEKIKQEHIKPKAKWTFIASGLLTWGLFAFLTLLSAVCFSLIYFLTNQLDWDLFGPGNHLPMKRLFLLLPYFWIFPFVLFLIIAYILFRHTKNGYRSKGSFIAILIVLLVLIFGFSVHHFRTDEKINNTFSSKVPGYSLLSSSKAKQWTQPEAGLIAGEITQIDKNSFTLTDFQGGSWKINYDQNTSIRPSVELKREAKIKIIGEMKNEYEFQAKEIRPWEGRGMMHGKREGNN